MCFAAYNMVMFLSALQPYVVLIIIAVVMVQYAFAIYCLLKLAYMNLSKNYYILWNLFILIVFFIGGAVFLVYYYKHPELRIKSAPPPAAEEAQPQTDGSNQGAESEEQKDENAEEANDTDNPDNN